MDYEEGSPTRTPEKVTEYKVEAAYNGLAGVVNEMERARKAEEDLTRVLADIAVIRHTMSPQGFDMWFGKIDQKRLDKVINMARAALPNSRDNVPPLPG